MLKFIPHTVLSPDLAVILSNYIAEEFGHVAFVRQRSWAIPDWVVLLEEQAEIVAFCNVVEREVTLNGKPCKIAGINNVITPKAHRGKGYSSRVLRETTSFLFDELKADYGLLLCADALVPFYERLGWYTVNSHLVYDQPQGKEVYDSNIMLLARKNHEKIYPKTIDLNGLPW
ncbi:MAG: GNAT family N-acetyltransferase [Hymenobacteraceae bacterium]|nr:GNAT family N-acetyltransferase [Hymenobacteraceae bacterium]MDX5482468.1 GNAT family N-acetyltransferase [Hymenobacteraceae bacterium]